MAHVVLGRNWRMNFKTHDGPEDDGAGGTHRGAQRSPEEPRGAQRRPEALRGAKTPWEVLGSPSWCRACRRRSVQTRCCWRRAAARWRGWRPPGRGGGRAPRSARPPPRAPSPRSGAARGTPAWCPPPPPSRTCLWQTHTHTLRGSRTAGTPAWCPPPSPSRTCLWQTHTHTLRGSRTAGTPAWCPPPPPSRTCLWQTHTHTEGLTDSRNTSLVPSFTTISYVSVTDTHTHWGAHGRQEHQLGALLHRHLVRVCDRHTHTHWGAHGRQEHQLGALLHRHLVRVCDRHTHTLRGSRTAGTPAWCPPPPPSRTCLWQTHTHTHWGAHGRQEHQLGALLHRHLIRVCDTHTHTHTEGLTDGRNTSLVPSSTAISYVSVTDTHTHTEGLTDGRNTSLVPSSTAISYVSVTDTHTHWGAHGRQQHQLGALLHRHLVRVCDKTHTHVHTGTLTDGRNAFKSHHFRMSIDSQLLWTVNENGIIKKNSYKQVRVRGRLEFVSALISWEQFSCSTFQSASVLLLTA